MVDFNKLSPSLQILMLTMHSGKPDVFRSALIKVLRSGSLDANVAAWLADIFDNGSETLKVEFKRTKRGNPDRQLAFDWESYRAFERIVDEEKTIESAFARVNDKLGIGKNRAREYWNLMKGFRDGSVLSVQVSGAPEPVPMRVRLPTSDEH